MAIIESEQSREIQLTKFERGSFIFRFASYRKSEDAQLNLRSEDYIVSDISAERALFCLSDGVGSSFYGDIGSQILGEIIIHWLQGLKKTDVLSANKSFDRAWLNNLTEKLKQELNTRVNLATSFVEQKDIISGKDVQTHLAEKSQRDEEGTQANFVGGILFPQSVDLPDGLVLLFWLGNARVRLFDPEKEITSLTGWGKDPNQLKEVWSSKEGSIGQIHSYSSELSKISAIIAYSDGLEYVENQIIPEMTDDYFSSLVNQAQSIKDDDISFIEISTTKAQIPGISDDIALSLRERLRTSPTLTINPPPGAEIDTLKRRLRTLINRNNEQLIEFRRHKRNFIIGIIASSFLFLVFGFMLGFILGPREEKIIIVPTIITVPARIITQPYPTTTPLPTVSFTPSAQISPTPIPSYTPAQKITDTAEQSMYSLTITPVPQVTLSTIPIELTP